MQPAAVSPGSAGRGAPLAVSISVALLASGFATVLRALAEPWAHDRIPYLTLYPAVIAVTLWAGWIPGAVTLAVGTALSTWLFVDWSRDIATGVVGLALMLVIGLALIALGNYQRCAARRWQAAAAEARASAEAMRASEERYRAMIELAPDAVVVYGADERVRFANPAAERLFDYPTLVGMNVFELAHPAWRSLMRERMARMMQSGEPAPLLEAQWVRADGDIIEGEVTSVRVAWEGEPAIQVMGRDCTDRKRAERALRESEARFRAVADDIPDIIYTCMPDGPCDYVNRRFTEVTGIPREEAIGYGWTRALHPDDLERAKREWMEARARAQAYEFRYRFRDDGGQYRWFMGRARPIRNDRGEIAQWYGTITDIDAMVKLEEHLQRRASDLAESNTDLEEFAQIVAHDLKEPLRGIATCAASVAEDYHDRLDADGNDRLETLVRLPKRMYQQLDALLEFSRVGKTRLATAETDLRALVDHIIEDLDHWLKEQEGEVRAVDPLPRLRCDPIRIEQLLRNLIVNGVKYNRASPRIVEIGADVSRLPPILYVRDNGIGVAARHFETIFAMFRRLHTREAYGGGAGAGLAIVKRIVERHRGRIWVESAVGRGTTFYFTLAPEIPPTEGTHEQGRREPPVVETPPRSRTAKTPRDAT